MSRPVLSKRVSIESVEASQKSHEQLCAIRYENIEKRLDSGSKRFTRIEGMLVGIYVLIIASQVIVGVQ